MCRIRLFAAPTAARLLIGLLFAISSVSLDAQVASESRAGHGFGPAYDAAQETTLIGTIQDLVTKNEVGSPAGVHLLVVGPRGVVDVHAGPFLSKATKEALQAGVPVQIVGATMQFHEKQYFLARELTVGGRTITVRNARGFLVSPDGDHVARARGTAKGQDNGGAR
jgi:hypothetical protein